MQSQINLGYCLDVANHKARSAGPPRGGFDPAAFGTLKRSQKVCVCFRPVVKVRKHYGRTSYDLIYLRLGGHFIILVLKQRCAESTDRGGFFAEAPIFGKLPIAKHSLSEGYSKKFVFWFSSLLDLRQIIGDSLVDTFALPHGNIFQSLEEGYPPKPRIGAIEQSIGEILKEILSLARTKQLTAAKRPARIICCTIEGAPHHVIFFALCDGLISCVEAFQPVQTLLHA